MKSEHDGGHMPNADRAAVAREATLRLVNEFYDAGTLLPGQVNVMREYIEREHPAPPAPETVTVDEVVYTKKRDGTWGDGSGFTLVPWVCGFLDRIASDARVIRERDARIAELEKEASEAHGRLTAARSKAEQAQRSEETMRRHLVAANDQRAAALRALEERANTAGPTEGVRESGAGSTPAPLVPAPPAPETVTVNGVTYEQRNDICKGGWSAFETTIWPDEWKAVALSRIASDARVLKERDARIAELERMLNLAKLVNQTTMDERDAALRALESYQNGIGPMGTASTGPLGPTVEADPSVPPDEIHVKQGGKLVGRIVDVAPPAPIPLGAVVEDGEGVKWVYGEWRNDDAAWRLLDSDYTRATDWRAANLTALYHARHPVATRETVERVYDALARGEDCHRLYWWGKARAALTAAGITVQEGA